MLRLEKKNECYDGFSKTVEEVYTDPFFKQIAA